jgi:hypothetical protein
MRTWWRDLDRILRGEATRLSALRGGTIDVPAGGLTVLLIGLAMAYGACMGTFSVFRGAPDAPWQWVASVVKVPALFVLTLLVTFPSLYVFNALVGSRLSVGAMLRLLVAALAVTVTVLASLGPIVAFFSASTTSYPFMILLNVAVFTAAGLLGMSFLLQTLHRLSLIRPEPRRGAELLPGYGGDVEPVGDEKEGETAAAAPRPGALEPVDERGLSRHVKLVFRCWVILFGLVGAQMGWVLRPFVGNPNAPFTWFRPKGASVFQGVFTALLNLFS